MEASVNLERSTGSGPLPNVGLSSSVFPSCSRVQLPSHRVERQPFGRGLGERVKRNPVDGGWPRLRFSTVNYRPSKRLSPTSCPVLMALLEPRLVLVSHLGRLPHFGGGPCNNNK